MTYSETADGMAANFGFLTLTVFYYNYCVPKVFIKGL